MEQVNVGDKVLVPRTGGAKTPGEVIDVFPLKRIAVVTFPVSGTFLGKPTKEVNKTAYKWVKWDELEPVGEEKSND